MENNKIINQDPPTEENTEEQTETTEEVVEESEGVAISAESLQQDLSQLKTEVKSLMNNMNHLVDIVKDQKKNSPRLVIKNTQPQKQKTTKDYLFELFPPLKENTY